MPNYLLYYMNPVSGHIDRQELLHVAQRAWKCAEQGLVNLVQRRRGPNEFSYLAIRRGRPGTLFGSLPSAEFEEAA